ATLSCSTSKLARPFQRSSKVGILLSVWAVASPIKRKALSLLVNMLLFLVTILTVKSSKIEAPVIESKYIPGGHFSAGRAGIATNMRYACGFLRQGFHRRPMPDAMPSRQHTPQ